MGTFEQGLVITIVGMGGTLLSLGIIILIINIGKWLLPYKDEKKEGQQETAKLVAKESV